MMGTSLCLALYMTPSSLYNLYHRTKKKFLDLSSSKRAWLLSVIIVIGLLVITTPQITNAGWFTDLADPTQLFAWVGSGVLWLMSGILGISAILLNVTILQTVIGMGNHINDIIGIQVAWSLLRDIANIIFIFSIVYIGISLILGINRHGHQQALARLVIIALIINFSLFLTKAVVETSNIMSTQIFRLIIPTTLPTGGVGCNPNDPSPEGTRNCINYGLTGIINNSLGLSTVFDVAGATPTGSFSGDRAGITSSKVFYITALGSIFLLITAFVFASAAVLLVIRFVILIMLMVFSPLAFAAWILPSTSGYFSFWLKSLLNQSFFAPAYMLMMWMTIKIIEGFGVATVTGVATRHNNFGAALIGANVGFATVFLNFAIITVFMVSALIVAKKFGAIGADKAYGIGKGWVNKAQSTAWKYKGVIAAGAVAGASSGLVLGAGLGVGAWVGGKRVVRTGVGAGAAKLDAYVEQKAPGVVGQTFRSLTTKPLRDKVKFGTGSSYSTAQKEYVKSIEAGKKAAGEASRTNEEARQETTARRSLNLTEGKYMEQKEGLEKSIKSNKETLSKMTDTTSPAYRGYVKAIEDAERMLASMSSLTLTEQEKTIEAKLKTFGENSHELNEHYTEAILDKAKDLATNAEEKVLEELESQGKKEELRAEKQRLYDKYSTSSDTELLFNERERAIVSRSVYESLTGYNETVLDKNGKPQTDKEGKVKTKFVKGSIDKALEVRAKEQSEEYLRRVEDKAGLGAPFGLADTRLFASNRFEIARKLRQKDKKDIGNKRIKEVAKAIIEEGGVADEDKEEKEEAKKS